MCLFETLIFIEDQYLWIGSTKRLYQLAVSAERWTWLGGFGTDAHNWFAFCKNRRNSLSECKFAVAWLVKFDRTSTFITLWVKHGFSHFIPLCEDCKVEVKISAREKGKAKATKSKPRSDRSGLQFSVGLIHPLLRKGNCASRARTDRQCYVVSQLYKLSTN